MSAMLFYKSNEFGCLSGSHLGADEYARIHPRSGPGADSAVWYCRWSVASGGLGQNRVTIHRRTANVRERAGGVKNSGVLTPSHALRIRSTALPIPFTIAPIL